VNERAAQLRAQILDLVTEFHKEEFPAKAFTPGQSSVPVSGKVLDAADMRNLVEASLDFWLTTGRFASEFERQFARYFGARAACLVNSGSSANLVALSCLTSPKLGDRRLLPSDEVITVAAGFPTTVNPILQNGLVPVFLDVTVPTFQVDVSQLEAALSPRTKALIIAHTLGNPFDLKTVSEFAAKHRLWLVEDCCDALGATFAGRKVGTFGDLATFSFYPAHHITMGEGGCVVTDSPQLKTLVESFRDWGRDCWCDPGKDNTCGKRFDWQLGDLPYGYDHKYTYSHIGYNLKLSDMQAAVGLSQFQKLPQFVESRRRNFAVLYEGLRDLREFFILPEATAGSEPSWFGFPLAVREEAPFGRERVIRYLEEAHIKTRLLFGGNLIRQPAYHDIPYRKASDLRWSDFAMDRSFWIGVYPGLVTEAIAYVVDIFHDAVRDLR
jgi:CDP-6-deoxy-D-xylo-4-hexulose-3-dehydrase